MNPSALSAVMAAAMGKAGGAPGGSGASAAAAQQILQQQQQTAMAAIAAAGGQQQQAGAPPPGMTPQQVRVGARGSRTTDGALWRAWFGRPLTSSGPWCKKLRGRALTRLRPPLGTAGPGHGGGHAEWLERSDQPVGCPG
jgi:hypothetical protein